jgi:uncharacterized protein YqeY
MQEQVKQAIKAAMIAKDTDKLQTMRLLSAALTNEAVSEARIASGKTGADPLTDEECVKVTKKLIKQRKDSIEQFIAGGREDLADAEKIELEILQGLLPAEMTREAIVEFVQKKIAELNPDAAGKGKFVGAVMRDIGSNADGMLVKEVVDELVK